MTYVNRLRSVLLTVILSLSFNAQAETKIEKYHGMCAGYHNFWMTMAAGNSQQNDMMFSMDVADKIDGKMKGKTSYKSTVLRSINILTDAMKNKNFNLVKSYAAVCSEINYPIGQNTGR